MEFVDSVANCKMKFDGKGRLFEPRTEESHIKVVQLAQKKYPVEAFWIGIRTRPHWSPKKRKFYYLSEG